MQITHVTQANTTVQTTDCPQWVIVENTGIDTKDVWSDRRIFEAALKELESCGGTDNGFDLMKRPPDSTLTTEFWPMRCIDLLAGVDGSAESACLAGARAVWAANHWPLAVQYYQTDRPDIWRECQDPRQADWCTVSAYDAVLAPPARQGYSKARGHEWPHHNALRSTAWAVVTCMEYHRSSVILVENVLDSEKWVFYPAWHGALRWLGYAVPPHLVDMANRGVP